MSVTTIEWTKRPGTIGETWNPTTGCNKVDRGCKHCYAEIMHRRLQAMGQKKYAADFLDGAKAHHNTLGIPIGWTKPRTVFVNSMSDLFHKDVPFNFIIQVFLVMKSTPQHTYLILTKRPEIALKFWEWMEACSAGEWKCPPNVWMGTSANDQESANIRVPILLKLTGCLLFLSYEPATGSLDLTKFLTFKAFKEGAAVPRLDWVIAGGESGSKADPSDPNWFRKVRNDCQAAGVPFFFKQFGLWHPLAGNEGQPGKVLNVRRWTNGQREPMYKATDKSFNVLDGQVWQQYPE